MKKILIIVILMSSIWRLDAQGNSKSSFSTSFKFENKIASQDRIGTSVSNNSDEYVNNNKLLKNGLFMDLLIGPAFLRSNLGLPRLNIAYRLGTKWYLGENDKYRPGIQMTWIRFGVSPAFDFEDILVNIYPTNIGYTSMLNLNDKMGLEFNVNLGIGFAANFASETFLIGFHANPEVKFRYKQLAIGVDFSLLNGTDIEDTFGILETLNVYSLSVGVKF